MQERAPTFDRRRLVIASGAAGVMLLSRPLQAAPSSGLASATDERRFTTDIRLPDLLFAVVARPPVLGARLVVRDTSETSRIMGVVAVAELAPSAGPPRQLGGIAVLARDTWSALRGRDALRLSWSRADPDGTNGHAPDHFRPGTAEPLFEPPSATALVAGGACEAWASLRAPSRLRTALAATLGLPMERVTLHRTHPAGGTDRTSNPAYLFEAARLSRALDGLPVSLLWTRIDDIPFDARPHDPDA